MKRWDQGAGIFFLLFGLWVFWQSGQLEYYRDITPGPGFLPVWLGVLFVSLGGLLLLDATRSPEQGAAPWKGLPSLRRVSLYLALFFSCVFLFAWLGLVLASGLFLLVSTRFLEGVRWRASILTSVLACLGLYLLFGVWLQVSMPKGPLGF